MLPSFNTSMVLPPFIGEGPGVRAGMAPYVASMSEFVRHFATSAERVGILLGLLNYRQAIRDAGVESGFQWLDGSFVEQVEVTRGRPPKDIDIVTFGPRPTAADGPDSRIWFDMHQQLFFDNEYTKHVYSCDAFFVDLRKPAHLLVDDTRYWFGLFSHQRERSLWKGMVQVPLYSDDDASRRYLDDLEAGATEVINA